MTKRKRALGLALAALSLAVAACSGDGDDDGSSAEGAEGADISEVRDALDEELRTTLATMLYENPGSRDYYLEQAEQDAPDVWEEINADGDVTLDEFRSIPDVQDAVNHYGGDVVQFFQDQMAAANN
jgi:hypothetical protein